MDLGKGKFETGPTVLAINIPHQYFTTEQSMGLFPGLEPEKSFLFTTDSKGELKHVNFYPFSKSSDNTMFFLE